MQATAIILAGGLGTRLRAALPDRPKVLAPVCGRPFITYLLDQVRRAGIRQVVISTGYQGGEIEAVIGTRWLNVEIQYAQEPEPLGTGGAVKWAGHQALGGPLLVMNGDSYTETDLADFVAWHTRRENDASLLLVSVPDAARFGSVVTDHHDRVVKFLEKRQAPAGGAVNSGVYVFSRELLEDIPAGNCSLETDVLPSWLGRWRVAARITESRFIDIGLPESYQASHQFMQGLAQQSGQSDRSTP